MPTLYGREWSPSALREYVGDISQLARVRTCILDDGPTQGVRALDFDTGSGLTFTVLPDRGMDIGECRWQGAPLAWRSPAGDAHPGHYDPHGIGWLRTFPGGLLATCGLCNVGPPLESEGESHGVHGRIGHTPARNVQWDAEWQEDEYLLWARGRLREWRLFGENFEVERRVCARMGRPRLTIEDTVTNHGFESQPLLMLYHFNFGFPLVDETTRLLVDSVATPRDETAAAGVRARHAAQQPTAGYAEQVFFHEVQPRDDGRAVAALVNRSFDGGRGLGVALRYEAAALPHLVQWKQMGQGAYVIGLEPATCLVMGRAEELAASRGTVLAPGESVVHALQVEVLADMESIERVESEITSV